MGAVSICVFRRLKKNFSTPARDGRLSLNRPRVAGLQALAQRPRRLYASFACVRRGAASHRFAIPDRLRLGLPGEGPPARPAAASTACTHAQSISTRPGPPHAYRRGADPRSGRDRSGPRSFRPPRRLVAAADRVVTLAAASRVTSQLVDERQHRQLSRCGEVRPRVQEVQETGGSIRCRPWHTNRSWLGVTVARSPRSGLAHHDLARFSANLRAFVTSVFGYQVLLLTVTFPEIHPRFSQALSVPGWMPRASAAFTRCIRC